MKPGHYVILHLLTLHNQNKKRESGLYVCGLVIKLSYNNFWYDDK